MCNIRDVITSSQPFNRQSFFRTELCIIYVQKIQINQKEKEVTTDTFPFDRAANATSVQTDMAAKLYPGVFVTLFSLINLLNLSTSPHIPFPA